jgi:ABC-type polar amino acid transport system ATPase subunit
MGYRTVNGSIAPEAERVIARKRQEIGMVFQQFNLFPHMTARQNVALAPRRVRGLSKRRANALAGEMLKRVGLDGHIDKYPGELSGGQQQRTAIARALAMDPAVMLFDEPTSALDPELVFEVLETIGALAKEGMTMIIVTHEMDFARHIADRVVFIDDGCIIEEGLPTQVLDSPAHERTRRFVTRLEHREAGVAA